MRTVHLKPTSRTIEHRKSLWRKRLLTAIRIKEQLSELPEKETVRDLPPNSKF